MHDLIFSDAAGLFDAGDLIVPHFDFQVVAKTTAEGTDNVMMSAHNFRLYSELDGHIGLRTATRSLSGSSIPARRSRRYRPR